MHKKKWNHICFGPFAYRLGGSGIAGRQMNNSIDNESDAHINYVSTELTVAYDQNKIGITVEPSGNLIDTNMLRTIRQKFTDAQ